MDIIWFFNIVLRNYLFLMEKGSIKRNRVLRYFNKIFYKNLCKLFKGIDYNIGVN